jgi:hypothetical protein
MNSPLLTLGLKLLPRVLHFMFAVLVTALPWQWLMRSPGPVAKRARQFVTSGPLDNRRVPDAPGDRASPRWLKYI